MDASDGGDGVISIARLDARGKPSLDYFSSNAEWSMPVAPEIVLPGVQPGDYDVKIEVPGSATWKSKGRKLGAAAIRIDVALRD